MDNGANSISEGQRKKRKGSIHSLESSEKFCVAQVLAQVLVLEKVSDLSKVPP